VQIPPEDGQTLMLKAGALVTRAKSLRDEEITSFSSNNSELVNVGLAAITNEPGHVQRSGVW
jgi:hypothetical protein